MELFKQKFGVGEEFMELDYILGKKGISEAIVKLKVYSKPIKKIEEKKEKVEEGEAQTG